MFMYFGYFVGNDCEQLICEGSGDQLPFLHWMESVSISSTHRKFTMLPSRVESINAPGLVRLAADGSSGKLQLTVKQNISVYMND